MIFFKTTERGFGRFEFTDRYDQKCSLQKSSLGTEDSIWLGVDVDVGGEPAKARMHLTREHAVYLITILQCFARTGEIHHAQGSMVAAVEPFEEDIVSRWSDWHNQQTYGDPTA